MAYEKYIKRNGKIYGPYTYHSHRVNGKVVSEYRGPKKRKTIKNKKKKIILFISLLVIILMFLWILLFNANLTGNSIIKLKNYDLSLNNSGNLDIILNYGELIPKDSILSIKTLNNYYEFNLSDLINEPTTNGRFFLEKSKISGKGDGYGAIGEKEVKKPVFFKLLIEKSNKSLNNNKTSPSSDINKEKIINDAKNITKPILLDKINISINKTKNKNLNTINNETNLKKDLNITKNISKNKNKTKDTVTKNVENKDTESKDKTDKTKDTVTKNVENKDTESKDKTDKTKDTVTKNVENKDTESKDKTDKTKDTVTKNKKTISAPLTGNIIKGFGNIFKNIFTGKVINENLIIQGDIKKYKKFTYSANSKDIVSIVKDSIKTEEKNLNESAINIKNNNGKITISTNYSEYKTGFGNSYIINKTKIYSIDLNSIGINLEPGEIKIKIKYKKNTLLNLKKIIKESDISENINDTEKNKTIDEIVNETFLNQTEILNNFSKNTLNENEKLILKRKFNSINISTTAENYRNKIIVNFKIGDYSQSNSYSKNLNESILKTLIEHDRIIFMKDLAHELDYKKTKTDFRNDLDSFLSIE